MTRLSFSEFKTKHSTTSFSQRLGLHRINIYFRWYLVLLWLAFFSIFGCQEIIKYPFRVERKGLSNPYWLKIRPVPSTEGTAHCQGQVSCLNGSRRQLALSGLVNSADHSLRRAWNTMRRRPVVGSYRTVSYPLLAVRKQAVACYSSWSLQTLPLYNFSSSSSFAGCLVFHTSLLLVISAVTFFLAIQSFQQFIHCFFALISTFILKIILVKIYHFSVI